MVTLYHLNESRSQRILWLLEELGVPYEIERFERDATRRAPPELRAVHPLGKSPVLRDGELLLCESGAIVDYLVVRYGEGRFAPGHDSPHWPRYVQWLHFAEGSAAFPLVLELILGFAGEGAAPFVGMAQDEIARMLDFLEAELGDGRHFAGDDFSAADLMLTFPIEFAAGRGHLGERPRLAAFLERMRARPAYQRAAEKA